MRMHPDPDSAYREIIDRFERWAEGDDRIRGAMIVGSRARTDRPADAWSDLDLVIVATDADELLDDTAWLRHLGEPVITFIEQTAVGSQRERRVLYEGGIDVDFPIIPAEMLSQLVARPPGDPLVMTVGGLMNRGHRILLDRDGVLARIAEKARDAPPLAPEPVNQHTLDETLNDFWYHCVWTAKKLRREELFVAHECLDQALRYRLLRLLRWHGGEAVSWHGMRFMEAWIDPDIATRYAQTWATHDRDDVVRAIHAAMDLATWLGERIASEHNLVFDSRADTVSRAWVRELAGSRSPASMP